MWICQQAFRFSTEPKRVTWRKLKIERANKICSQHSSFEKCEEPSNTSVRASPKREGWHSVSPSRLLIHYLRQVPIWVESLGIYENCRISGCASQIENNSRPLLHCHISNYPVLKHFVSKLPNGRVKPHSLVDACCKERELAQMTFPNLRYGSVTENALNLFACFMQHRRAFGKITKEKRQHICCSDMPCPAHLQKRELESSYFGFNSYKTPKSAPACCSAVIVVDVPLTTL